MTSESSRAFDFQKELIFSEAQIEHANAINTSMHEPEIHLRYLMAESSVVALGFKHLSKCAEQRARLADFLINAVCVDPQDEEFTAPVV